MNKFGKNIVRSIRSWLRWGLHPYKHALPDPLKHLLIAYWTRRTDAKVFLETGTYRGDTVQSVVSKFNKLYSIEIDPALHAAAQARFSRTDNIKIILGDSSKVLAPILSSIDAPVLVWLDAHYSGGITGRADSDTPIEGELEIVLTNPLVKAVLIDDMRCFNGANGYPTIGRIATIAGRYGRKFRRWSDVGIITIPS